MSVPTLLLTVADIAARLGFKVRTIRSYHQLAQQRRRRGASRPGDFPPPDARYGLTPVWEPSSIDEWVQHRPGRGAGGGRPRKEGS